MNVYLFLLAVVAACFVGGLLSYRMRIAPLLRSLEQHLRDEAEQRHAVPIEQECDVPPLGWRCTRELGHRGPCAAVESPDDVALVERGMARLREAHNKTIED